MNMENERKAPEPVPFAVYECSTAHLKSIINRLIWFLVASVIMLFASNMAWIWYESQFETITYQQEGATLNNICTGEQGALYVGTESEVPQEAAQKGNRNEN